MKRYKLIVAYDGTNYSGWQLQENAPTIEGVVNEGLSRLLGQPIQVIGASRTDAGVHACGNVAVFDAETTIPGDRIKYALNSLLPPDVRIMDSEEVDDEFHPRFCDTVKTYEYVILNTKDPLPMRRLYTYWYSRPLDVEKMRKAAQQIPGKKDFKSFCAAGAQVKTTIRNVTDVRVRKEGDLITIQVKGEGFLYNMVRIIAGTLIKIGDGSWNPEKMTEIIESKDRTKAGPTAPPQGLTLVKIEYIG
ncbi:MAG: tRNA pseudouridine(38-40) synthase TruA [Lachnospiraceae bacterium]|nr:tRNA pseudouridine(38-40) synthase TruA [Lachnospiraceae bacterium]